jgi:hypothetical protein
VVTSVLVQVCEAQQQFEQARALERVCGAATLFQSARGEITLHEEPVKRAGLDGFSGLA